MAKLTEDNKNFIRKNYLIMTAEEMADAIGRVTKYAVTGFKTKEGLRKLHYTKDPQRNVVRMDVNGFFNVHALENWVA